MQTKDLLEDSSSVHTKSFTTAPTLEIDYEEWQTKLLKLCEKLSDIENSRQHAIYTNNMNKYSHFVNFKQIDAFDLLPNAVEALTALDRQKNIQDPMDLDDLTVHPLDDRLTKKKKKLRPFTSVGRDKKAIHVGDEWKLKFKLLNAD